MSALTEPWIPEGLLTEAHLTANTTINVTGAGTPVTGTVQTDNGTAGAGTLQVTFGAVAGRRYTVMIDAQAFSSTAGDDATVSYTKSGAAGNAYANVCRIALPNTGAHPGHLLIVFYPSATASVTFTVTLALTTGTGPVNLQSGSMITAWGAGLAP